MERLLISQCTQPNYPDCNVAFLKARVFMQLRKISSSDNEVLVYIMYLHVLTLTAAYSQLSDKLISHNMYECFINTRYLCAYLKKICKFEP